MELEAELCLSVCHGNNNNVATDLQCCDCRLEDKSSQKEHEQFLTPSKLESDD